jgi:hypothetical protein
MINGTNHIIEHVFVDISRSHPMDAKIPQAKMRRFCFGHFLEILFQREILEPKEASVSKGGKQSMCEHRKRRSKGGKYDLGGHDEGKHPSKC